MSPAAVFLIGLAITLVSVLLVVMYLRTHLKAILVDLCGTAERAEFWTAFSNITITLVPLIFALHYRPEAGSPPSMFFAICAQLEQALIGLALSVFGLGLVIAGFIRRSRQSNIFVQQSQPA
jgi:hypothetical protein